MMTVTGCRRLAWYGWKGAEGPRSLASWLSATAAMWRLMLKGLSGSLVNSKSSTVWKHPLQVARHRTWMGYVPPAMQ